ncbi:Ni/Fe hydrogenase subunit alpha [Vulgatibacter sp.]|uniref:Ni/Fe hydrogenase subunit alpha n=1 Tax=Vulgatibacter sp. TaxID=1971226 RepID=UPI0035668370
MARRIIEIPEISRVEGQGAVTLRLRDGGVESVELRIFEPPRLFEALLRGRSRFDAPDITARICGICPVAYLMSACHALESAAGIRVDGPLRSLRRLLYCGEWIESHALHVFLLHLPDFFGLPDGFALAVQEPEVVRRGLRLKAIGNALVARLGGRSIHPVSVRIGGFYRVPGRGDLDDLLPDLRWGRDTALELLGWAAQLPFPDFDRDYTLVSLQHPDEYPMCEGRIAISNGGTLAVEDFDAHFTEEQVPWSTALQAHLREGGTYLCGPLARYHHNFERLAPTVRAAALAAGLGPSCTNPYKSLLVRLVEIAHAFDEATRIAASWSPPPAPFVEVPQVAGTGHGCTEAPRGILYHRYTVDEAGQLLDATNVPPTTQNLATMEGDLAAAGGQLATLPRREARLLAQRLVRNHDPCISCSTHFLELHVEEA